MVGWNVNVNKCPLKHPRLFTIYFAFEKLLPSIRVPAFLAIQNYLACLLPLGLQNLLNSFISSSLDSNLGRLRF